MNYILMLNTGVQYIEKALDLADEDDLWFIILCAVIALVVIGIPVGIVLYRREQKLLDENGKTVEGTIVRAETNRNGYKYGVIAFDTERGEETADFVQLEKWQKIGDTVMMEYCYDSKGKIQWRIKD